MREYEVVLASREVNKAPIIMDVADILYRKVKSIEF
jgi:hypothetical protein